MWFDGQAENAARFYVSLLPDSRIEQVTRAPADTPSGPAGMVLTVAFKLSGLRLVGHIIQVRDQKRHVSENGAPSEDPKEPPGSSAP